MGLESLPGVDISLFNWATNLDIIESELSARGWREIEFGLHLGRHSGALDLQYNFDHRILVYPPDPIDRNVQIILDTLNLPRLPIYNLSRYSSRGFIVAQVPFVARALDSLNYPDQESVTTHLGSIEIMKAVGELLGRVYRETQMLPRELKLRDLALTQGENDIIKFIPPITLSSENDVGKIKKVVEYLGDDLRTQDPIHQHQSQIKELMASFERILEGGKKL